MTENDKNGGQLSIIIRPAPVPLVETSIGEVVNSLVQPMFWLRLNNRGKHTSGK